MGGKDEGGRTRSIVFLAANRMQKLLAGSAAAEPFGRTPGVGARGGAWLRSWPPSSDGSPDRPDSDLSLKLQDVLAERCKAETAVLQARGGRQRGGAIRDAATKPGGPAPLQHRALGPGAAGSGPARLGWLGFLERLRGELRLAAPLLGSPRAANSTTNWSASREVPTSGPVCSRHLGARAGGRFRTLVGACGHALCGRRSPTRYRRTTDAR